MCSGLIRVSFPGLPGLGQDSSCFWITHIAVLFYLQVASGIRPKIQAFDMMVPCLSPN